MPWDPAVQNTRVPAKRSVLTDDVLTGLVSGTVVSSDVAATIPGIDASNVYQYALECVWAVLSEELDAAKFVVAMRAIGEVDGLGEVLENVFWCVWSDLEGPDRTAYAEETRKDDKVAITPEDAAIQLLIDLLARCRQDKLVDDEGLVISLDQRLLTQTGVALEGKGKTQGFAQRCGLVRSQRRIKVVRFLLLREDTEGYAKLLTLLNNRALVMGRPAGELADGVHQLVAYFSLHAAKVAACALRAVELNPASAEVRPPRSCAPPAPAWHPLGRTPG